MRKALGVMALLASFSSYAGCEKDTDCKGARVCNGGQCVADDSPFAEESDDASALARAERLAIIHQLKSQLFELREELADSGLYSPIVKLSLGAAAAIVAAIALASVANQADCARRNFDDCGDPQTLAAFAVGGGIVAGVFLIWGGIQLYRNHRTQEELPPKIQAIETQLHALGMGGEAAR